MPPTDMIPFFRPKITPEAIEAVTKQLESGRIGPGERCEELEESLSSLFDGKHVVLSNSGTTALSLCREALGIERGGTAVCPGYGVPATANGIKRSGLSPGFLDVRKTDCAIPATRLQQLIGEKPVNAVCVVDHSGTVSFENQEIRRLCSENNIPLIEDAACGLANGTLFGNKRGATVRMDVGRFGDVTVLSFSVPKVITAGQGGAIVTSDFGAAQRARAAVDHGGHGWRETGNQVRCGGNLRMTDMQAALLLAQLGDLAEIIVDHRRKFDLMSEQLPMFGKDQHIGVPLHNIVFSNQADALIEALAHKNIEARKPYRVLSHHTAYLSAGRMPGAEAWAECAVYLPFGPGIALDECQQVVDAIKASGIEPLPNK